MKNIWLFLVVSLAGCFSTPPTPVTVPDAAVVEASADVAADPLDADTDTEAGPAYGLMMKRYSDAGAFSAFGPSWELHFSPSGGCTDAIVALIGAAKLTVLFQAYGFTSKPIIAALLQAHAHGVAVTLVLDRSDAVSADGGVLPLNQFLAAHVPTFIDKMHAIAHNKVIVVDSKSIETGSFNFTYAAEHQNAENCLIEKDVAKATAYTVNFNLHKAHSVNAAPLP